MIFNSARLRLTAWYLIILSSIIIAFSVSLFFISRNSIYRSHERQVAILRGSEPGFEVININQAAINEELGELSSKLIVIDLALVAIAGLLSFFLATNTLEPIRSNLERQKQFVSNASHELKTPLAILQAEIDITLRRDRSKAEYKKTLTFLKKEVLRLTKLSKNLLILAGSNERLVEPVQVKLADLINDSLTSMASRLAKFKLALELDPVMVRGDKIQLRQMIDVFIDNAAKYTKKDGTIKVALSARGRTAQISFFNSGTAIPKKDQAYIFRRFFRSNTGVKRVRGVGLGLSIAQTIVDNHQGEIRLDSKVKNGTRFLISLPIAGPKDNYG